MAWIQKYCYLVIPLFFWAGVIIRIERKSWKNEKLVLLNFHSKLRCPSIKLKIQRIILFCKGRKQLILINSNIGSALAPLSPPCPVHPPWLCYRALDLLWLLTVEWTKIWPTRQPHQTTLVPKCSIFGPLQLLVKPEPIILNSRSIEYLLS